MDDAQIRESIEEFVAEGNELWQRETGRDPEAAGVRPSEVVGLRAVTAIRAAALRGSRG
jgi:hypothetical protein